MAYLRKLCGSLKLQTNEAKSAVGSAFWRKFLGYALWVARSHEVKCAVAMKALDNFTARIRELTRRSGAAQHERSGGEAAALRSCRSGFLLAERWWLCFAGSPHLRFNAPQHDLHMRQNFARPAFRA